MSPQQATSGSRGGLGTRAPPCPQYFFKIMQFSGNFWGKTPYFEHILGSALPLGVKIPMAPPWPKSWIRACKHQLFSTSSSVLAQLRRDAFILCENDTAFQKSTNNNIQLQRAWHFKERTGSFGNFQNLLSFAECRFNAKKKHVLSMCMCCQN